MTGRRSTTGTQRAAIDALGRVLVRPAPVALVIVALVVAVTGPIPTRLQYVPLVVSVAFLGLPHGAVDHLAPARVRGERPDMRAMLRVGLLYAVVGGAYAVAWFLAPALSFALFIAITWAHWGQGDVHALVTFAGDHLRSSGQRVATAAARGGLPMLVPLLAFPREYRRVARTLVGRFGDTAAVLDPVFATETRIVLGVGYTLLVVGTLAVGLWRARRVNAVRDWTRDAGETVLLGAFFATVPPVLAIGVFFTLWHSARHVARLLLVDPEGRRAAAAGDVTGALARFARDAAPLTAASVVLLGIFYVAVPVPPGDVAGVVGLYLVLIAALTLPHVLVVSYMDTVEGVWREKASKMRDGL